MAPPALGQRSGSPPRTVLRQDHPQVVSAWHVPTGLYTAPTYVDLDLDVLRQGAVDVAKQEIVQVLGADRARTIDVVTREGNAAAGAARGVSRGRVARRGVARSWRVRRAAARIGQPAVRRSRHVPGGRGARPSRRLSFPQLAAVDSDSADDGADGVADRVGDRGCSEAEQQLPDPGAKRRAAGEGRHRRAQGEQARSR